MVALPCISRSREGAGGSGEESLILAEFLFPSPGCFYQVLAPVDDHDQVYGFRNKGRVSANERTLITTTRADT